MTNMNLKRVLVGGLLAGLVLVVAEIVLELLVFGNIPGVGSERERLQALDVSIGEWGAANHLVQSALPFAGGILLVWVYAAIRPRFGPGARTAFFASLVFVGFWLLILVYFTNLGVLTLKHSVTSFVDNLIVLPIACITGAKVYREH